MMDENRFFKAVWRINGIIILIATFIILIIIGTEIIGDLLRKSTQRDVITNVATDTEGEEKWRLGYARNISGTSIVFIPLVSEKEYVRLKKKVSLAKVGAYSYAESSFSSPTKNILYVNGKNNEQRWLFPTNDQLITTIEQLENGSYSSDRKTLAMQYRVIKGDTNGDKRLTREDESMIAFSKPDGTKYKEVLSEVDDIISSTIIDNEKSLLIYQRKGIGYSATLSLVDFSITNKKELPKVKGTP